MSRYTFGAGSYPEFQDIAGGRTFPVYGTVNEAAGQLLPNQRLKFGDSITDRHGNSYLYVRAVVGLSQGQVVRSAFAGDGDVPAASTIAASTTVNTIFTAMTTTLAEMPLGSLLASPGTSGGTGQPFLKFIKGQVAIGANTTFNIAKVQVFQGIGQFDGDSLATIPATSDAVVIVRPYNVAVHGAVSATTIENGPVGVALGTVTAAGGTLIQTGGICQVLGVGSGTAIVAGGPLSPGATGTVIGGSAVPDGVIGRSYVAWTSTSHLIPCRLYLDRQL